MRFFPWQGIRNFDIEPDNAGKLFGAKTFYSAEGSSLCIKAMLFLVKLHFPGMRIAAGRKAHKSFLNACIEAGIRM